MNRILLSTLEAAETLGISQRLFNELRHTAGFPKPVQLSQRCIRWVHEDLSKFVDDLPRVALGPEPEHLRRSRRSR